jgi:glutathione S-transferase
MLKLYGTLASPYVARVVLAARYKKLDLPLEMPAGGLKSPGYLALNPFGKMPTLGHGGRHVIESQVICEYLEELYPVPSILPGDVLARARARTLSRAVDLYVAPEGSVLLHQLDPAGRDAAAVEAATGKLTDALDRLDGLMAGGPWAAGEFSLADCTLLPYVVAMKKMLAPAFGIADPVEARPQLTAWWRQVLGEPLTAAFVPEYGAALDALIARLRGA